MDSAEAPSAAIGPEEEQAIDVVAVRRARLKEWFAGRTLPVVIAIKLVEALQ